MSNEEKKLTVTIGIPAYNEEANIAALLHAVLQQEESYFTLTKIIVVSDASRDNTVEKVEQIDDRRISLVNHKHRKGQIFSQNEIFSLVNTDIVILLEADTIPQGKNYLYELLLPIIDNKKVGLVQGSWKPLPSQTFTGKVFSTQMLFYQELTENSEDASSLLCSGRGGRAFTERVYKQFHWPQSVPEDVYALSWCQKNNIMTVFQKSAICNYRSPQSFSDYVKERQKIKSAELSLFKYFSPEYIHVMYHRSFPLLVKLFLYFYMRHPILAFCYTILKMRGKMLLAHKDFSDFWPTTDTTKIL